MVYILGVTGQQSIHDPSACLLKNGKLISAVEEERLIREKHASNKSPINAIKFCLDSEKISMDDVDYIAVGWDHPKNCFRNTLNNYSNGNKMFNSMPHLAYSMRQLFLDFRYKSRGSGWEFKKYFNKNVNKKIHYIDHHLAHAATSYRCSGFKDTMIFTADNRGETTSTLLGKGENDKIHKLKEIKMFNSLGLMYGALTEFLGFRFANGEGKTMGLAPYGKPIYDLNDVISYGNGNFRLNHKYFYSFNKKHHFYSNELIKKFGNPKVPIKKGEVERKVAQKYCDIAASLQKKLEDVAKHLITETYKMYGSENLSIAGGVGLNCVMNGKLLNELDFVKNIFIQPAANDAGCSLGAALELSSKLGYKTNFKMNHAYWGPEFSNEEIEEELKRYRLDYEECEDISGVAAELIADGKVVGWFQGKLEWGPRALGNRSILVDPTRKESKDIVNIKVKFREPWRPFAPSILLGEEKKYFENAVEAPYMLLAFKIKPEKIKELPSVCHVDNTSRPQTVDKEVNPKYYKLIEKVGKITGTPIVLNTSFNIKGEPIVCRPKEAIEGFLKTDMDFLAIGDYLVSKKK